MPLLGQQLSLEILRIWAYHRSDPRLTNFGLYACGTGLTSVFQYTKINTDVVSVLSQYYSSINLVLLQFAKPALTNMWQHSWANTRVLGVNMNIGPLATLLCKVGVDLRWDSKISEGNLHQAFKIRLFNCGFLKNIIYMFIICITHVHSSKSYCVTSRYL